MIVALGRTALALLALSFVGLILGIGYGSVPLLVTATAVGLIADQAAGWCVPDDVRQLEQVRFGLTVRSLLRCGLLAAGLAHQAVFGPRAVGMILAVLLALHLGVAVTSHFERLARRRVGRRHGWRNLAVGGVTEGPPPYRFLARSELGLRAAMTGAVEGLLVLGVLASTTTGTPFWLLFAAAVALVGIATMMVLGALRLASVLGGARILVTTSPAAWRYSTTEIDAKNAQLRAAVAELRPEVVVYFSSPANGTYALNVWLTVLAALRPRTLIVLRESVHLTTMGATELPVVVLPQATDLEAYQVPSMKVALFPTNVVRNNHMVRLENMLHCFIGHGDSDKAGSFSPVSRVYDEIWVAGPAGAERYAGVSEGFQLDRIRTVGRPQLEGIVSTTVRPHSVTKTTVLYAPTWEGFFEESDYCSLASMGERIVDALLAAGATVLFKPHPSTGQRDPEDLAAARRIAERLAATPGSHQVVENEPAALYRAFNVADVLVTDISSLISDFLFSRKPCIVTNPRAMASEDFAHAFPSTAAAYILREPVPELPGILADIVGVDSLRDRRESMRAYLLGEGEHPLARFVAEVDAFVQRSEQERVRRHRVAATFESGDAWR